MSKSSIIKITTKRRFQGFVGVSIALLVIVLIATSVMAIDPIISTDKLDYTPGEIVTITGTGFAHSTEYSIPVKRPDGTIVTIDPETHAVTPGYDNVTSDVDGNFVYEYQLNGIEGLYEVRVYDTPWVSTNWDDVITYPPVAVTTFTDSSITLQQCRNGADGLGPCDWTGGNAGASNSHLLEGEFIPYRLAIPIAGDTSDSVTIGWDITKYDSQEAKHAIDYIGTYNDSVSFADPCDPSVAGVSCNLASATTYLIPPDNQAPPGLQIPGEFTIWNGTITSVSSYGLVGDPTVETASRSITINYTVDSGATGGVVIAWGGHIAHHLDWEPEPTAAYINGSPYHTFLVDFGSMDVSLNAGAVIVPGKIIIEKQTTPDGSLQSFDFDPSWSDTNFPLHDGETADSGDLEPGAYSVTEIVPADWDNTSIICDDGSTQTPPTASIDLDEADVVTCTFYNELQTGNIRVVKETIGGDGTFEFTSATLSPSPFYLTTPGDSYRDFVDLTVGTYDVAETVPEGWDLTSVSCDDGSDPSAIGLDPNETVVCTFVNTKRGKIVVEKETIGGYGTFGFTGGLGDFDLTTVSDGDIASTDPDYDNLLPGTFAVYETDPTPEWDLTSAYCNDGSDPSAIGLDPGETVTCRFVNTKRGSIVVVKNTIGGDGTFEFTSSTLSPSPFYLTTSGGTDSTDFVELVPGTYDVAETEEPGPTPAWDLTDYYCSDGSDPSAIGLNPGETVTCYFENTRRGSIRVVKNTYGGDGTFEFTSSTLSPSPFYLTTSSGTAWTDFVDIPPDTYDVAETVPTGWDLTSATCDDGSLPSAIGLDPGETVVCTFENTKRGKIVVEKETIGGYGTLTSRVIWETSS